MTEVRDNNNLYSGNSMRRVFRLFDQLQSVPTPWEELRAGDIVIFFRGKRIVHRIIVKGDDFIVTCGDNNGVPDSPLSRCPELPVVTGFIRRGRFHRVAGGEAGLRVFRRNRRRRAWRHRVALGVFALLNLIPRLSLEKHTRQVQFKDAVYLYFHQRPVARLNGGKPVFLGWWWRMLFKNHGCK